MSQNTFQIIEHIVPAQHVREYPNGAKVPDPRLKLAVKEYRPRDNLCAPPGSVTLIAAHANGCPKECYEALWTDLYHALGNKKLLRAIWIADASNQGASGILNEDQQGDDPNWFGHSRDLLQIVNHFQDAMPQPILGVAHSMGAAQLAQLSIIHPRLLHSLALIEPTILDAAPRGLNAALPSSYRPDLWPSREVAEAAIRKTRFFSKWDSRALDNYLEFGLRSTPTAAYPAPEVANSVTLATTKHQEAWSFVRSNFGSIPVNPEDRSERLGAPDLSPEHKTHLFHKAEMVHSHRTLPYVRPHVLWIFGEDSNINTAESREDKLKRTGTGLGGSGGCRVGQVEAVTLSKGQHMLPLERPQDVAQLLASWIDKKVKDYDEVQTWHRTKKSGRSEQDMTVLSTAWMKNVRQKESTPRPRQEKL